MRLSQNKCPYCDFETETWQGLNSHIGYKHHDEHYEEVKCKNCGETFERSKNSDQKYCSEECYHKGHNFSGQNNPFHGKRHTQETNKQISTKIQKQYDNEREPWNKGLSAEEDERVAKGVEKMVETNKNRSEEHQRKINESLQGRVGGFYSDEHKKAFIRGGRETRFKKGHTAWNKGMTQEEFLSDEGYKKLQEWREKLEENPELAKEFISKCMKFDLPTSLEKMFINICDEYNLPFKYVGDRRFWIRTKVGLRNPDFIHTNGKNICIEILGEHWHDEDEFQERKKLFEECGWKCLGIWEKTLKKKPIQEIVGKVMKYENNKS